MTMRSPSAVTVGKYDYLERLRQLLLGNFQHRAVELPRAESIRVLRHGALPIVVHRHRDPRLYLLGELSRLRGCHRVEAAGDRHQQNVDLAHHFELLRGELVAEVAEMRDADVVDAE